MQNATQALDLLTQYEGIRQKAIEETESAIADLQAKLARLTSNANGAPPKEKVRRAVKCSRCGTVGHTTRTCKQTTE